MQAGTRAHPLLGAIAWVHARLLVPPTRRERGDMPGWVLITVMTAGIVVVLWQVAGTQLKAMLQSALSRVTGP